jgi:methylaspartate mutase sigma subunit
LESAVAGDAFHNPVSVSTAVAGPFDFAEQPLGIVTTTMSDAHTWNLVFVESILHENGYRTLNLGPCTPIDDVVAACVELSPDLLVVSTINGHGVPDAGRLIRAIRAGAPSTGLPVVIGGNFGPEPGVDVEEHLLASGYSKVFLGDSAVPGLVRYLGLLERQRLCRVNPA